MSTFIELPCIPLTEEAMRMGELDLSYDGPEAAPEMVSIQIEHITYMGPEKDGRTLIELVSGTQLWVDTPYEEVRSLTKWKSMTARVV